MQVTITTDDVSRDPFVLDRALKMVRSPGDVIILGDNVTAATQGTWAFEAYGWISLANGVSLRGGHNSVIRFSSPVLETRGQVRPAKDLNILWAGDGCSVSGLTFDCTAPEGWNGGGLRFHGRFNVTDCVIKGLSGTIGQQESFAISSTGDTSGTVVERVVVHECFTATPTSYVSGIYIGATSGEGGNQVIACDVDLGPHGWFAYSSTRPTVFDQCVGKASRFWYTDTGDGEATVQDCSGAVSYAAVSSVAVEGTPLRRVLVRGCHFIGEGETVRAAEWWDKTGAKGQGHVVFDDCEFESFSHAAAVDADRGAVVFVACSFLPSAQNSLTPRSPQPIFV